MDFISLSSSLRMWISILGELFWRWSSQQQWLCYFEISTNFNFKGFYFLYLQVIWLPDQSWHPDLDFFLEQISVLILLELSNLWMAKHNWHTSGDVHPCRRVCFHLGTHSDFVCLFPFVNTFWFLSFPRRDSRHLKRLPPLPDLFSPWRENKHRDLLLPCNICTLCF